MIGKNTSIETIVEKYPKLVSKLRDYGVLCVQCGEPIWGTLGEQMDEKGIANPDKIIKALNQTIKSEE